MHSPDDQHFFNDIKAKEQHEMKLRKHKKQLGKYNSNQVKNSLRSDGVMVAWDPWLWEKEAKAKAGKDHGKQLTKYNSDQIKFIMKSPDHKSFFDNEVRKGEHAKYQKQL